MHLPIVQCWCVIGRMNISHVTGYKKSSHEWPHRLPDLCPLGLPFVWPSEELEYTQRRHGPPAMLNHCSTGKLQVEWSELSDSLRRVSQPNWRACGS
jgi:hypothetical protein